MAAITQLLIMTPIMTYHIHVIYNYCPDCGEPMNLPSYGERQLIERTFAFLFAEIASVAGAILLLLKQKVGMFTLLGGSLFFDGYLLLLLESIDFLAVPIIYAVINIHLVPLVLGWKRVRWQ
jgi:hypothetical protein